MPKLGMEPIRREALVKATIAALTQLRPQIEVERLRGVTLS